MRNPQQLVKGDAPACSTVVSSQYLTHFPGAVLQAKYFQEPGHLLGTDGSPSLRVNQRIQSSERLHFVFWDLLQVQL